MRHAGSLPRRRRRYLEVILAGASAFNGWGCHQYFYYGNPPYASAPTVASTVEGGTVCELPTQVVEGGTTMADPNARPATTIAAPKSPRVVVSEPDDRPRLSWRRTDPEASIASSRAEGGADDSTVDR